MTAVQTLVDSAVESHRAGDWRRAEQLYTELVDNAATPEILNNLGIVKNALGDVAGAFDCYRRAIELKPDFFEPHNNLGNLLWKQGQLAAALERLQFALTLRNDVITHCTIGSILTEIGRFEEATAAVQQVLQLKPEFADAYNGLGVALQYSCKFSAAIDAYQQSLLLKPDSTAAHINLANALTALHRFHEAEQHYREALRINPDHHTAANNFLMLLQYDPDFDAEALFFEHCKWGARLQEQVTLTSRHANNPEPLRKLRIGYVSPDFRKHSVAYFIEPILRHHDPQVVETFCYAEVAHPDQVTQQLQHLAGNWRFTNGLSDEQVARTIHNDQIDILIDLAGHTASNRLGVFARKPAPIQVAYLGYGNTTGLDTIDYRISDSVADPVGEPVWYTEQMVRLLHGILCFSPPAEAPECTEPPMAKNGFMTFGSFNRRVKMNPQVIQLWSEILQRIPLSRLVLKDRSFVSDEIQARTRAEFLQQGIDPGRIELIPRAVSMSDHLQLYSRIDIALDPFPYGGSTTSCEALWMGVPVLTLRGNCYVSRMTSSLLTQIGLTGFIAESPDDYVRRAAAFDGKVDCLTNLRRDLRPILAESAICDGAGYTRELEEVYRQMWIRWCASHVS